MALYHQHNVNHSTFGNCEHFAPHGSFMLRAIFFGHSAVRSSITPINQATKYLRRRAVLEIPPLRERLACQFRWYGTRHW